MWTHLSACCPCLCVAIVVVVCCLCVVGNDIRRWGMCIVQWKGRRGGRRGGMRGGRRRSCQHKNKIRNMRAHLCAPCPCLCVAIVVVVCCLCVVGNDVCRWGMCSGRGGEVAGEVGGEVPVSCHKKGQEVVPSLFAANHISTPCLRVAVLCRVRVVSDGVHRRVMWHVQWKGRRGGVRSNCFDFKFNMHVKKSRACNHPHTNSSN